MAILFTRTLVVPVWLLAFALIIVLAPPPGMVTNGLLLVGALLAVLTLLLRKSSSRSVASGGPRTIDIKPLSVTAVPRQSRRQRWTSRW